MSTKRTQAKTDPELKRQLKAGKSKEDLVQAVFTLHLSTRQTDEPTHVEEMTQKVLDRVADEVGIEAKEINIFRNLGAFAVSASPDFIRALLSEPEIATATANQQQESMMIPPQRKRRVT